MPAAILTEALTKRYGHRLGIEALHLEVRPGEIFGFIGPNGAGKTTTIRLLLDLLHPTSGSAQVLGLDAHRESVAVRRSIGYLPGEFGLPPRTTGRQLVRGFARLRGLDDLGAADRLAERLGLDLDVPTGRLSRGNRQKVGIVQALFHKPALAILDEPTTGLDPLVQDTFLQLLREAQSEGRTVFLSSHVLSEVERVCDRVAIVRGGHLAALETTGSLLEKRRKRVMLVFASPVDAAPFAELPGISEVSVQGNVIWMRIGDGIDGVIKLAARHTLLDLSVEHPSLDEVFMGYYEGSGPAPGSMGDSPAPGAWPPPPPGTWPPPPGAWPPPPAGEARP
jgi:ABC-2 type transport system ATP-binding protein